MKYLLDTCVVSDFIKGEQSVTAMMKRVSPSAIALSSISVMEFYYGLFRHPERAKKIGPMLEAFLHDVSIISFEREDAEFAGIARAALTKEGNPIGSYDVLIAGMALRHDLILVTSNLKEFERIPRLKLENWRAMKS